MKNHKNRHSKEKRNGMVEMQKQITEKTHYPKIDIVNVWVDSPIDCPKCYANAEMEESLYTKEYNIYCEECGYFETNIK